MYKVIVVEDEEPIRNILCQIIDWNSFGFDLVFQAGNGQEALDYLSDNDTDLVITDIMMPFVDGIELCRQLKILKPSVKTIILSGYNDFEYAREAIKYNVSHYLLKPITALEFKGTLEIIKKEMDEQFANQKDIRLLKKQYQESRELLKNNFLMNLILGYTKSMNFDNLEKRFNISLSAEHYRMAVIDLEESSNDNGFDRSLLEFAAYNIASDLIKNIRDSIVFIGPDGQLCIIIKYDTELDQVGIQNIINCLEDISYQIKRLFRIDSSIGLSNTCDNVIDLKYAYKDALDALEYKVLEGPNKVIIRSNMNKKPSFTFNHIEDQLDKIEYSIKINDTEALKKTLEYIFSFARFGNIGLDDFKTLLLKMLISVNKIYIDNTENNGIDFDLFNKIFKMNNISEIQEFYFETYKSLAKEIEKERNSEEQRYIIDAKKYIDDNYSDSTLTLDSISTRLFLSSGYFSRLFKKSTGLTFIDYLTEIRMQQAKKLLTGSNMKVYEISVKVGYDDPNYFSYNFKKHVGVTPSVYRKGKTND